VTASGKQLPAPSQGTPHWDEARGEACLLKPHGQVVPAIASSAHASGFMEFTFPFGRQWLSEVPVLEFFQGDDLPGPLKKRPGSARAQAGGVQKKPSANHELSPEQIRKKKNHHSMIYHRTRKAKQRQFISEGRVLDEAAWQEIRTLAQIAANKAVADW
jgi:hypothetical protein